MSSSQIFPAIMIVLNVGAMAVYLYQGNIRMGTYWLAAAWLTYCVVFYQSHWGGK